MIFHTLTKKLWDMTLSLKNKYILYKNKNTNRNIYLEKNIETYINVYKLLI